MRLLLLFVLVAMASDFLGIGTARRTYDSLDSSLDYVADRQEEEDHLPMRRTYDAFHRSLRTSRNRPRDPEPLWMKPRISEPQIPDSFDAREVWKGCCSIREIHDQGACSTCWAVAITSVMNDRTCIKSHGKDTFQYSAHNLAACCLKCGDIVQGAPNLSESFNYWKETGIVSGDYGNCGCQPYHVEVMEKLAKNKTERPQCKPECDPFYPGTYYSDLRRAEKVYQVKGNTSLIQKEIMTHGPVAAGMFFDGMFDACSVDKVYTCNSVGGDGHAVRIIGWGEEAGGKYWLIANSWGRCNKPVFKVKRGINSCGIESHVWAGIPET